jgi:hypothetical protein
MADFSHSKRTLSFMKIIAEQDLELRELKQADREELEDVNVRLNERTNELNSLYEMLRLQAENHSSLDHFFQAAVDLIPMAFQDPELASARIQLHQNEYSTCRYRDSKWKLTHDITVGKEPIGTVEVCYTPKKPDDQKPIFSSEAERYLAAVAETLAQIITSERCEVETPNPSRCDEDAC